jgi:hypothetical protein
VRRPFSQVAEAAAVLQNQSTCAFSESLDACRLMTRILVRVINGNSWQSALANDDLALATPKTKKLTAREWKKGSVRR